MHGSSEARVLAPFAAKGLPRPSAARPPAVGRSICLCGPLSSVGPVVSGPPTFGHSPVTRNGHPRLPIGEPSSRPPTGSLGLRHRPGLVPNRRLKQVLNKPKWLKPHSSAT